MITHNKFFNHLSDLNIRLLYISFMLIFTFSCCYIYSDSLIYLFIKPFLIKMDAHRFIFTSLIEIFFTYIKFSAIIAFLISLPFIFFQIWLFLIPGLYKYERKSLNIFIIFIILIFLISVSIIYFLILPNIWKFFLLFEQNNTLFPLHFEAKINDYLFIMLSIVFNIVLCFQVPSILLLLTYFKIFDIKFLINKKKLFYLILLIIGTIISSPDIISQLFIISFLWVLYEFSILILYFFKFIKKY